MRSLLCLTYLLIGYGSLFPFDFSMAAMERAEISLFQLKLPGIGDILGNVLLFVPTGFISYTLPQQSTGVWQRGSHSLFKLLLWGGLFALLLQLIQLTLPQRDPSIIDVVFNILGLTIGWQMGRQLGSRLIKLPIGIALLPMLIGAGYFLSQLSPFVPTIDLQSIKNSLKPLLTADFSITSFFVTACCWLVAIRLIFWQHPHYRKRGLLAIWLLVIVGKVLIYKNTLVLVDLTAPLLSLLLLTKLDIDSRKGLKVLIGLLLLSLGLSSLAAFSPLAGEFSLIPLSGFLQGDMHTNVGSLLSKLFIYSAIVWLAIEAGINGRKTAILVAALALLLEFLQIWMPSRSAEIGEPLLVFIAYLLVRNVGDYLASQPSTTSKSAPIPTPTAAPIPSSESKKEQLRMPKKANSSNGIRSAWIPIGISFIAFIITIKTVLALPGIPYNVLQLFRNDGSIIDLSCFYLALLLAGGSAIWISTLHQQQTWPRFGYLAKLHILSAGLVYLMVWFAVSEDSLQDITGTVLSVRALSDIQQQGTTLAVILKVVGVTNIRSLLEFVEPGLRFFALYGLFQVPYVYFLLLLKVPDNKGSRPIHTRKLTTSALLLAICYYFTFPAASTDNLTELISAPLMFCLLLTLYALMIALMVRSLLSNASHKLIKLGSGGIILSTLGWIIAQYSFTEQLHKYGVSFSALEFILGPDRNTRLTIVELLLRWFCVSVAFQLIILWGARLSAGLKIPSVVQQQAGARSKFQFLRPKLILIGALAISLSVYMTNRLFGENLHWQTLSQHFTSDDGPNSIDTSVAVIPADARPGRILLDGVLQPSLKLAFKRAKDHSIIQISPGHYNEAAVLTAHSVVVKAEKGAVIYGKAAHGKGALVLKGNDTIIEGLECHSISVPDGNGKCVRLEGIGVTLRDVYFHHAQGGILGSRAGGDIIIENSLFEHLGTGSFSHGVYSLGATRLIIRNSKFINNRNGAHEIKSRSFYTEITDSVIAAPQSRDSRLIDVANGGVFILKRNILIEGPFSENHDMLSWGVEHNLHKEGSISIKDNLFISDLKSSRLISIKNSPEEMDISGNTIIGDVKGVNSSTNYLFKNREDLSLKEYPNIPNWTQSVSSQKP
ncbi:MAG: right-handed parallel beta-helix repeat-containing protein [Motiliproteus sp.]